MQVSDVPQEYAIRYAVVNRSVYAYWGPGYDYTMYKNPIPAGTEGTVWQTENGYAQLEFYDSSVLSFSDHLSGESVYDTIYCNAFVYSSFLLSSVFLLTGFLRKKTFLRGQP